MSKRHHDLLFFYGNDSGVNVFAGQCKACRMEENRNNQLLPAANLRLLILFGTGWRPAG